jgi:hypothetical protein
MMTKRKSSLENRWKIQIKIPHIDDKFKEKEKMFFYLIVKIPLLILIVCCAVDDVINC